MSDTFPALLHARKTVDALIRSLSPDDNLKAQLIYLQGQSLTYRNDTDREMNFRQESNFYYLTGCDVPASALVLFLPPPNDPPELVVENIISTLLIPEEDPLETMWSLPPPTLDEAESAYPGHSSIQYTSMLPEILSTLLKTYPDTLVHTLPSDIPSPFPPLPLFFSDSPTASTTPKYLLPALHTARLIKTQHEIELIRKANAISSRAHELIMRLLGKYATADLVTPLQSGKLVMPEEWRIEKEAEAEAAFVASCRREGSLHQAYLPIVAGAERASTLHYCCNDRDFAWGPLPNSHQGHDLAHEHVRTGSRRLAPQVLLLDAGCEWKNYASDITRTTPVGNGGKFTKEARDIYSLVLKMQNDAIASLHPGVHWDTIHYNCHVTLVREFISLGIFVGNESEILDSQISTAFYPHGLGHSLGLDVHDVPSASKPTPQSSNETIPTLSAKHPAFYTYLRLRLPLAAGMVLTVEPGIYFSPHLLAPHRQSSFINHEVLAQYETVGGVRIEDVLVITDGGSENLTTVGKDIDWLEAAAGGHA